MTGLFLFYFEQLNAHKSAKISSVVAEILSFSCLVLLLETSNSGHLGLPKCKNNEMA